MKPIHIQISITFSIILICLIIILHMFISKKKETKVLGDMTTSTQVFGCRLDIIAKPEQRASNNWGTDINVEIYNNTNTVLEGSYSIATNNLGENTIDLCDDLSPPVYLDADNYYFYLKGKSHISKQYSNLYAFEKALTKIDFSSQNNYLIAGDTNSTQDDEINSLDITHLIRTLNTENGIDPVYDETYDLNLDGFIDTRDADILIHNFYLNGENLH